MAKIILWGLAMLLGALTGSARAQPQGGEAVAFESPQRAGAAIMLRGVLYKPSGPAKGAVVLVHGSGGWSDGREGHYGRALSAAGYAVLAIDTYGPRSLTNTVADQGKLSTLDQTMDAFAARRHLLGLGHAADRTAIMGFSRGGTVAIQAADRNFLPHVTARFALALPFYAGCTIRPRQPRPAGAMFVVLAEKDDWVGVTSCRELADAYAAAGGEVVTRTYAGATHGFDGDPAHTRLHRVNDAETFVDCVSFLEPDGTLSYGGRTFDASDTTGVLGEMRKVCVRRGGTVWTHLRQKEAVTRDVIEFLDARF